MTPSLDAATQVRAGELESAAPSPVPHALATDPLWYKDAIIYQLHVKAFFDANDDGIGDFPGLTRRLDYLQELGVTALWLLPFYPSPLRDDGYDIADYRNVNSSYGTMADVRQFVREAHRRGMRVITELVVNHTSDQHPWFQRARRAKRGSRLRDFYVWSDTDQKFLGTRIIFLDTEKSNWAWDPVAQAYYWHRFYSHQPDLNFDNPRVFRAITNVMKFWLDIGVDGMRLDAVPYLIEREGTINENLPETHDILKRLRAELDRVYGDRMLLAEANQWPEDVRHYFGEGDECHMAFHFPLMPRLFMAVATEDRHPITDIMRQTPEIPENCQWAVFLRNHDELTLEMVTDRERDYLWAFYASDRRMRLNLGIRRRLTPLMENDRRKIELLKSVMFSMPGTPVMYYGDEIGMGDNVFLGDRDGVRTPMQWTPDRNGGFSRCDPARLYLPPIMDPVYGYQAVNVEAQRSSPSSLLNWVKRLIAIRRGQRAFGRGTLKFLYPRNRKILAYLRQYEGDSILCVVNLARSPQAVELDLSAFKGHTPIELMGRSTFPRIGELPYLLTLQAYGFFWFVLAPANEADERGMAGSPMPEYVTLVLPHGWTDLLDRHNRPQLEGDVLPNFLAGQRWFQSEPHQQRIAVLGGVTVPAAGSDLPPTEPSPMGEGWHLLVVERRVPPEVPQLYLLPLGLAWESDGPGAQAKLCEVRRFRRNGTLFDAATEPDFVRALCRAIVADATIAGPFGEVRCRRAGVLPEAILVQLRQPEESPGEAIAVRGLAEGLASSAVQLGEAAVLRLYRRLQPGPDPEVEMASFLAAAGFANTPPLLGAVELALSEGQLQLPLGILVAFVRNQGEAWTQALDYISRYLEDAVLAGPGENRTEPAAATIFFFELAQLLGTRSGEMHRALCPKSEANPAFAPEPISPADLSAWQTGCREAADELLHRLSQRFSAEAASGLAEPSRTLAARLLAERPTLDAAIATLLPPQIDAAKTRIHGDYHLGQILVVQNDFHIVDFAGDKQLPTAERRAKSSPLRDVATMLRSFDYVAAAGLRQLAEIQPALRSQAERFATEWRQKAKEGFLAGYFAAMKGCPSLPADRSAAERLLAFFSLRKAIDEALYELANRPGWLAIPLAGILDVIAREAEPGEPYGISIAESDLER